MTQQLNPKALGFAGAIISAGVMFLLGVLAPMGIYAGAGERMMGMHMFFAFGTVAIITGMIEAAVLGFVFLYLFAVAYNKML